MYNNTWRIFFFKHAFKFSISYLLVISFLIHFLRRLSSPNRSKLCKHRQCLIFFISLKRAWMHCKHRTEYLIAHPFKWPLENESGTLRLCIFIFPRTPCCFSLENPIKKHTLLETWLSLSSVSREIKLIWEISLTSLHPITAGQFIKVANRCSGSVRRRVKSAGRQMRLSSAGRRSLVSSLIWLTSQQQTGSERSLCVVEKKTLFIRKASWKAADLGQTSQRTYCTPNYFSVGSSCVSVQETWRN